MKTIELAKLGTLKNGMNFTKSASIRGCKIIGVSDFQNNVFPVYSSLAEIDSSIVKETDLLQDGDIVFVRSNGNKSLVGRSMIIKGIIEPICYSGFCISLRPNQDVILPEYLFYALRAPYCRVQYSYSQQTNITNLSQSVLGSVKVPYVPVSQQKKIAQILTDIDNKIALNKRINAELETMAKTIYDYWFVQFDFPDENGKPYRTFGGAMEWNEQLKREIPKGWSVGTIGDLGAIVAGGTPDTTKEDFYCSDGIAWITPNDLSGKEDTMFIRHGDKDITEKGLNNSSANIMPCGAVLLSTRAPIGYLAIADNVICTNQGFKSIVPSKGYSQYFIYYCIKRNLKAISQQGVGTTFKEVSKDTLSSYKVTLPSYEIADAFSTAIGTGCSLRRIYETENLELTRLRDWLLPMLMNGQATVE